MSSRRGGSQSSRGDSNKASPKGKNVVGISSSDVDPLNQGIQDVNLDSSQDGSWEVISKKNKNRSGNGNARPDAGQREKDEEEVDQEDPEDNTYTEDLDGSDDELLSEEYDSDESPQSHETRKQNRWYSDFFATLDTLTVEQINEPTRQWHCPACKNGPGSIDRYRSLQSLVTHAKTKGSKRVKIHRDLAEILEEELRRRGATVVPAGEAYRQWKGLNEVVKDREIVWPPMVVIMNTQLEQDENVKWLGMGNQELLDYFGNYEAVRARHSYGPKGHRGMSLLIFESTAVGYTEAERLSKHFEHQGTDRDAWDHRRNLFYPGGKRQLYGYMATKRDMDVFNQHSPGKSKLKFELVSYQEKVVNQLKQMNEDNQQLHYYKTKVVKEQKHSKALEEANYLVSQKLRKTEEQNRIVRDRTQKYHEQNKEEDKLEPFMDPPVAAEVETKSQKTDETKGSPKSYDCGLCDIEVVYKIAQELLPGLASACVDSTTGGLFKSAGSIAVDMRKEMADYLTQRSESYVAEFLLNENATGIEVSEHPYDIIISLIDDFTASKRNMFSRVSEWVLSDRRDDRIDDFVHEMEINGFWLLPRRECISSMLLKNVDYKNAFHCNMVCNTEEEVGEHISECKFRPLDCTNEGCTTRYCAAQKEHHEVICPFMILPCEQKCSDFVMRREMDRHCVTICPMKLVNCAFYTVGCQSSIPRCNVQQHNADDLSSHLRYIIRVAHKEATDEDLKYRVEQIRNLSNTEKLARARDARALTYLIKDVEAKLEPLKVETKPDSKEMNTSKEEKVVAESPPSNKKESPIKTEPFVKDGPDSDSQPNKNEMNPSTEKVVESPVKMVESKESVVESPVKMVESKESEGV